MEWIYFSPHLDDIALSAGGLLWEQANEGANVHVWTICAGDPPPGKLSPFAQSLHRRWKAGQGAMDQRRKEDIQSCQVLGAQATHFSIPDCIYRRSARTGEHIYDSEEALWRPVHPDENGLIDDLSQTVKGMLPKEANLVCPLGLGNHVDHRLTRQAVEAVVSGMPESRHWNLFYYADYPYVLQSGIPPKISNLNSCLRLISTDGLSAWQDAIAQHRSQISTFWENNTAMRTAIQAFYHQMGGIWLGHK